MIIEGGKYGMLPRSATRLICGSDHALDRWIRWKRRGWFHPWWTDEGIEAFSLSRQAAWLVFRDTIGCVDTPTQDILTRTRVKKIRKSLSRIWICWEISGQFWMSKTVYFFAN